MVLHTNEPTAADIRSFYEAMKKKLNRVLRFSPVWCTVQIRPKFAVLHHTVLDQGRCFDFDMSLSPEENIAIIQEWMIDNWFPKVIHETKTWESPDAKERLTRSMQGESLESLLTERRQVIHQDVWVITRFNPKETRQRMVLTNLKDRSKQKIYELFIPSEAFLRRLVTGVISPQQGWEELQDPIAARFDHDFCVDRLMRRDQ